jgi:Predicted membrane protein
MDVVTIVLIAIGLAMDAFAVSITSGLTIKSLKVTYALRIALFFGFFQAVMSGIGWLAGFGLRDIISGIDHWIAFGLLSLIGCKMICEATRIETNEKEINPLNSYLLLLLAIATSIDALAVGLSLSFLTVAIVTPAVIIGIVTFLMSFLGVFLGNGFGHFFEHKIELIGGLTLIGIGVKIVIEHSVVGIA